MKRLRSIGSKVMLLVSLAAMFAMSIVGTAFAEAPNYGKLTEGVEDEFLVIVPIVLAVLGAIIGIAFAIRWGIRKFGGTR